MVALGAPMPVTATSQRSRASLPELWGRSHKSFYARTGDGLCGPRAGLFFVSARDRGELLIPTAAADGGGHAGDECADQHGKRGEKGDRGCRFARTVRSLLRMLDECVDALLGLGLRGAGPGRDQLGEVATIARGHTVISQAIREDAHGLRAGVYKSRRRGIGAG